MSLPEHSALSEQRVVRAAWSLARARMARLDVQPLVPTVLAVCVELHLQGLSVPGERVIEVCRGLGLDLAGVASSPSDETREWNLRGPKSPR